MTDASDMDLADFLIGKGIVVELTYVDAEAREVGRFKSYGVVKQVSRAAIEVELKGQDEGEILNLPPLLSAIRIAEPGEYTFPDAQEVLVNPALIGSWTLEQTSSGGLPRWVQVCVGVLLTPLAILCCVGAATIFTIPKVKESLALLTLAAVIALGCIWALQLCVRLVIGFPPGRELLGPLALRAIAIAMLGLVVAAFFNGYFVEQPFIGGVMAISYVLGARRLWKMAAIRRQSGAPTR